MTSLQQFSGKIYPDYSFSIGKVPRQRKRAEDSQYDKDYENQYDSFGELVQVGGKRVLKSERFFKGYSASSRFIKSSKLSQTRKPYGRHGITANGKKIVKNCAVLLERKYTIKRIGFVTATIPAYSRRIIHIIARSWSEILRRFFQKIKRLQEKLKVPTHRICCTEIQPKRFRKYGCVAPHIHFLYVCKTHTTSKKFIILANMFRRFWQESIEQVIIKVDGKLTENVSFKSSIDCQVVNKSAAAYLGKYLSKGGEILQEIHEKGMEAFLPKQWWTASNSMKKWLQKEIIVLDQATCKSFFYQLGDWLSDGVFTWCNYITIEYQDRELIVGCVGKISEEHYYLLRET